MRRQMIASLVVLTMLLAPASAYGGPPGVVKPLARIVMGALPASPVSGTIASVGDEHLYSVNLVAGQLLDLRMTGPADTDYDLHLYIEGSAGTVLVASSVDPESEERIVAAVPKTGEYTLSVLSWDGAGAYTLTYSIGASVPDDLLPGVVLPASPVTRTFDTDDARDDYYRVDLTAGQVFDVAMDGPDLSDLDLLLYSPYATWETLEYEYVALSDYVGTADEHLIYRAEVTGTYYLCVHAYKGTGAYRLTHLTLPSPAVRRIAGPGRIETAIAASVEGFPAGAESVVITTARNWPDALGGSALAGLFRAPILLTEPGYLPDAVADEIARLGADHALILGGTGAVSQAVEDAVKDLPGIIVVERIQGATRYETAQKTMERINEQMAWEGVKAETVFVATGEDFPDALAASPLAASWIFPILLLPPDVDRHAELVQYMRDAGVLEVFILGGTGVVPASFETRLNAAFGADKVERLWGDDRYETAADVAGFAITRFGRSLDRVAVATGQNYPDALAGGVMQAQCASVLLLTHTAYLDAVVEDMLETDRMWISEARVLGGTGAVSEAVRLRMHSVLQ
ncbi:MAG: cell wall-binding repeat-containing protein [Actinomycetota bacterium]